MPSTYHRELFKLQLDPMLNMQGSMIEPYVLPSNGIYEFIILVGHQINIQLKYDGYGNFDYSANFKGSL